MSTTKTTAYVQDCVQTSGILKCPECGAVQPCPPKQAAEYLRIGWPKHCDVTMQLAHVGPKNGHAKNGHAKKRASR